ncbi:glyceraldehyde-3-phosphate dehydrogenase [Salipiger pallidus]|uniref:Glyceraldehyde-3-phosphate dehydrogenase n=1 Tax=Salipiger pallidus TaxID=1775170 RepID=A0A8J2ZN54_9RHOB|nr:glyceraldehyde 3-phosphate dehydrogenase NAD-binding domain-containing protein [Salipiger pallidus]GGG85402.1 glyceraldehyde-3-phosphate dehydrogenase [Salipiger pallidus]
MARPVRIFINGFGRIGRTVFRQVIAGGRAIEIVGINDVAPLETCAYLLRYDSVFGPFPVPVETAPEALIVAGRRMPFHAVSDLRQLALSEVDMVLECTGRAGSPDTARAGLDAGASRVLISGPSKAADLTFVMGASDALPETAGIVSNASCTTNAIAPLLQAIDARCGIARAHVTTIHCATASQPTTDRPGETPERSRASHESIVPTSTSAAAQVLNVLPALNGRLSIAAARIPSISVSAVDAVIQCAAPASDVEALLDAITDGHIIGGSHDPCVSVDFRGRTESLILARTETQRVGDQLRIFGWYDNEAGFSARMLDMAERLAQTT